MFLRCKKMQSRFHQRIRDQGKLVLHQPQRRNLYRYSDAERHHPEVSVRAEAISSGFCNTSVLQKNVGLGAAND